MSKSVDEPRLEYHQRMHYSHHGKCHCWYYNYVRVIRCLNCVREKADGGRVLLRVIKGGE